jgi:DNA-binding response OmpR family regulator
MEKILVVDDEEAILDVLHINLQRLGYDVITATNGKEALTKALSNPVDLILLDLGLPDMDGFQVAELIRKSKDIPIIFVTAKSSDMDRILGLEKGGDDYIVKPFNPREVAARVGAVLRRLGKQKPEQKVIVGSLVLDLIKRKATFHDQPLDLTPKEFDLLHYFVLNPGKVLEREKILRDVWGTEHLDYRTVDVHVKNLRNKLKDEKLFQTAWGKGYIFFNP